MGFNLIDLFLFGGFDIYVCGNVGMICWIDFGNGFFFWVPMVKVLVLIFFWFCNVTVWEIKKSRNFGFLLLLMLVIGRLTKPRF
jgi:hypothetical protein